DGTVASFAVSGACSTVPDGMNKHGLIVGFAFMGDCETSDTIIGFLRARDGTMTTFSGLDGWGKTAPKSVDAKGAIVGVYIDDSGVQRAFVRSPGGVLRRYNALKGAEIDSITSNDRGVIAGSYYENGISGGFVQAVDGTLTKFGAPDGTN